MRFILLCILMIFMSLSLHGQGKDSPVYATKDGAIKGYDPVAYFTDAEAVKGQTDIAYDWNGATWYFSSESNRELFKQDAEKYAPQYGGWCAYAWSNGKEAKISPDAWSIVDGKLYLNYNQKVQKKWNKKQAEYIQLANEKYTQRYSMK